MPNTGAALEDGLVHHQDFFVATRLEHSNNKQSVLAKPISGCHVRMNTEFAAPDSPLLISKQLNSNR